MSIAVKKELFFQNGTTDITGQFLQWDNADDLASTATAPRYYINNILEEDSHGIVCGASMSFKTFMILRLAYSICTGLDFFGHTVFAAGKVLYICGEGKGALARRTKALELNLGSLNNNLFVLRDVISIDNKMDMFRLRKAIKSVEPTLVIIDTFASLISNTKENDTSEVGRTLRLIKETCRNGKTSSLIVHHFGKDATKGGRGASNFVNDVDFYFEMIRDANTMITTLVCKKMKDGDNFENINMLAEVVDLNLIRQDGSATTSLVLTSTDQKPLLNKKGKSLDAKHQNILTALVEAVKTNGIATPIEIVNHYSDAAHLCPQKVVHLKDFRQLAYVYLDVVDASKRVTLKRCIDKLVFCDKASICNDYIWCSEQENRGTKQNKT